jgi:hypothetical protein
MGFNSTFKGLRLFFHLHFGLPNPVAARSKVWVCGLSFAGIAGSIPTGSMDVCLLWGLIVNNYRSLRRAANSYRGVWCVWLRVITKPRQWAVVGLLDLSSHREKEIRTFVSLFLQFFSPKFRNISISLFFHVHNVSRLPNQSLIVYSK